jgi:hypothetical protein
MHISMHVILSLVLPKVLNSSFTSQQKTRTIVRFESHAIDCMVERGFQFRLPYETTREYAIQTVLEGKRAKKHTSKRHRTYFRYFKENITVYVICQELKERNIIIKTVKTVIIERGRP